MTYPGEKEDFTPVASPEWIRQGHINELQTLLEILQFIIGLFPNWVAGAVHDVGDIFMSTHDLKLSTLRSRDAGTLVIMDKDGVRGLSVELGGNVGVKTVDPAVALDVTGEINSTYGFYHDRGDPAAYDFTVASFPVKGSWTDLDLSAIVPAGTKAVALALIIQYTGTGRIVQFRKNGNANVYNIGAAHTVVANLPMNNDIIVACGNDRKIEYKISNVVWTRIDVVVKGWWK